MRPHSPLLLLSILTFINLGLYAQNEVKKTQTPSKGNNVTSGQKNKENPDAIYHTVGNNETLFSIAKKNGVTVDDIKKWNKLSAYLHKGDRLIVGFKSMQKKNETAEIKIDSRKEKPTVIREDEDYIDEKYKQQKASIKGKTESKEFSEKTVATWIDDGSVVSNKCLALHTSAPEGTIIKVTNTINQKTVYVKVIGNITKDEETSVTIKMTKAAADKLGAIDKFFRVELHYATEFSGKDKNK